MSEKCPNCGGEIERRPDGLYHKGPRDTWIRMSEGGWQSCLEKQLIAMTERAKAAEAESARLKAALLPFALYAKARDGLCDESRANEIISALPDGTVISLGHLREAAEAAEENVT